MTEVLVFWSLTLATTLGGKHETSIDKSYKVFASFSLADPTAHDMSNDIFKAF